MPNLFLDVRGRVERSLGIKTRDEPSQALRFALGDVAGKMVFSPMKTAVADANGTLLFGIDGVRYYVHSSLIFGRNAVGNMNTYADSNITVDGVSRVLIAVAVVPNVANCATVSMVNDVMSDENTPITLSTGLTEAWLIVNYQEVREEDA